MIFSSFVWLKLDFHTNEVKQYFPFPSLSAPSFIGKMRQTYPYRYIIIKTKLKEEINPLRKWFEVK